MHQDDVRAQLECILQMKMNISYTEVKNMTDDEILYEYKKFRWFTEIENKAYKNMKK